jgi:hypothetical protein
MIPLSTYNINEIYWNPINFNLIGGKLKLSNTPYIFDNGMSFLLYDCLIDLKDISFNNKSGIFLTNLNQNKNILKDNSNPNNVQPLTTIDSILSSKNLSNTYYKIINNVLSGVQPLSGLVANYNDYLVFSFENSKVSISNTSDLTLTDLGSSNQVGFSLTLYPPNSSQYFDYLLGNGSIAIFRQGTNFSNVLSEDGLGNLYFQRYNTSSLTLTSFFSLPSYQSQKQNNTSISDSFIVKYESNPSINQNELVVSSKDNTYQQNYLGIFPTENFSISNNVANCNLYLHGLKNYQDNEYRYTSNSVNRVYNKIFSGTNQEKGLNNIHLSYQNDTINLKFPSDSDTKFLFSPTSNFLPINDAGFIEAGAIGGDYPAISDRIYTSDTNLTSDAYNAKINNSYTSTNPIPKINTNNNKWLCSWLSGSNSGGVWLDRYYNSAYYSQNKALSASALVYNDRLDITKTYVYDVPSVVELLPGIVYTYHHVGINDNINYVKSLDYKTNKRCNVLTISNWLSSGLMDLSTYGNDGLVYDSNQLNFNENYWQLDGTNYALFPSNSSLLPISGLTVGLWLNVDDWGSVDGYQIFGNYYNSGFGLINDSKIYAPIITIINNNSNVVYNLNYALGNVSNLTIPNSSNAIFDTVQKLPNFSYWVFSTNSNYLSGIKYDVSNNLLTSINITQSIPNDEALMFQQIDQVLIDSKQNMYLYDSNAQQYLIMDVNGSIFAWGPKSNYNGGYVSQENGNPQIGIPNTAQRIEIDLQDNIVYSHGNASTIDNDGILWEIIGENLYYTKDPYFNPTVRNMFSTVGKAQQIVCDFFNNLWIILKNEDYIKFDKNRNISFIKKLNVVNQNVENNCTIPQYTISKNLDYLNETENNTSTPYATAYNQKNNLDTFRVRNMSFINTPYSLYTNTCGLTSYQADQAIIIDQLDAEAYIINQQGEPVTTLGFYGLTNSNDFSFITKGDFTGYDFIRKYKSNQNNLTWYFEISSPSTSVSSCQMQYNVSNLAKGWQHFAFVFNQNNNTATYYINCSAVNTVSLPLSSNLYYQYDTSLLLGAASLQNKTLNDFLNIDDGYKFVGKVSDLKMYNLPLNNTDIEKIYFSSKFSQPSNDLIWGMQVGTRNYIEEIKHWFKFQMPGSKSKYFNINIHNLKANDQVKSNIEMAINNIINKIKPANTGLYKVNWK